MNANAKSTTFRAPLLQVCLSSAVDTRGRHFDTTLFLFSAPALIPMTYGGPGLAKLLPYLGRGEQP